MNSYNTKFTIGTFNLFNYISPPSAFYDIDNIYSQSQWQKKEQWIARQLMDQVPDIVGFQEVFSPKALEALTARCGLPYFATVSEPSIRSAHVYDKPVVALASRFPILSAEKVEVNTAAIKNMNLQNGFQFSRPPIRALIKIDDFSTVLVYVLHLKSKRSQLESRHYNANSENSSENDAIAASLLAEIQGSWASSIQRGTEAALIYQDVVQQMLVCERPVVVMGDLNDTIESSTLLPLVGSHQLDKLDGTFINDLSMPQQRVMNRFLLHDAFDLHEESKGGTRKATHYFVNQGSVLDYILLSKDFKSDYDHSLASVSSYQVCDRHLVNPHHAHDAESSDHAPVMIEIEIRS